MQSERVRKRKKNRKFQKRRCVYVFVRGEGEKKIMEGAVKLRFSVGLKFTFPSYEVFDD